MTTATKTIRHTHPNPAQWANYLAICGIDKGVFSKVETGARRSVVAFENGVTVIVTAGKLQDQYTL